MSRLTVVTQLAPTPVENDEPWRGLPPAITADGGTPFVNITYSGGVNVSATTAEYLRVPAGTAAFCRDRVQGDTRTGTPDPIQLATSWYTLAALAAVPEIRDRPDVDPPPVRRRMLDAGRAIHYEHTLGARGGSVNECALLGLPSAAVVFELWRVCVETGPGVPLEVTRIVANPARVRFRY